MNLDLKIVLPVVIAFCISVVLCPIVIPFLKKLKFGQFVRDDGPQAHLKKAGTPTMGGLIILLSLTITTLIYMKKYPDVLPVLFVTLGFGLIGFIDDYIKVVMKRSMGLHAWQKMLGQIVVTGVFAYYVEKYSDINNELIIPFLGKTVQLNSTLYVILLFFIVLGTVNGANFTDGLDGLASSVTVLIATFFAVVAVEQTQVLLRLPAQRLDVFLASLCTMCTLQRYSWEIQVLWHSVDLLHQQRICSRCLYS